MVLSLDLNPVKDGGDKVLYNIKISHLVSIIFNDES